MKRLTKILSVLIIIACVLTILPTKVYAAGSYSAYVGTKTITVGKSTSLTITTKNAAGQFNVTSSNSAVAKVTRASTWVDGRMDNAISIKGVKEGTATITITPTNVSDNEYNLLTKKTTIKVTVKKASTTAETTKPTTPTKSSDATLKSLSTELAEIDFKAGTTKYTVNVDKTVTSLGLKAAANNSKATVKITGDSNFVVGNNTVTVKVTAEDGTTKTYEILVVKSKYGSGPLTDLKVKGYELNKEFEPSELEYSVDVMGVTSVEVEYTKAKESTTVEVIGNDNLKEGKNTIKVIAITDKGVTTVYTINVNVAKTATTVVERNNMMWLIIIIILIALVIIESLYIVIKDKIVAKKQDVEETEITNNKKSDK